MPSNSPQHPGTLQRWSQDERGLDLFFERGRLRVVPLTERMVRVCFTPEADFAPRRSWSVAAPDEAFSPVAWEVQEGVDKLALTLGSLRFSVAKEGGLLACTDESGHSFATDSAPLTWGEAAPTSINIQTREGERLQLPEGRGRTMVQLRKGIESGEGYYGFGQRIGLLDRRGRRITNWTMDPAWGHNRSQDNLYQAHPFFMALRPGLAWGCFLNSTWYSQFDVGATDWNQLEMIALGGELDYYLFYGPTPAQVVEGLTRLTGRPFLPPLWALGYHQSRWGYMNEGEIRELAESFHTRDIPLDVIHFDIDYMHGYRDFTWHPERFPDPKGLLADLREQGVRVVTIIDPGVKNDVESDYPVAKDGLEKEVFIRNPDGSPFVGFCWPDAALFPDFARAETRTWWGDQHVGHLETGVAGIWNDMNEPAIFDRPFSEGFSKQKPMPLTTPQGSAEEETVHAEVHNLYGLLMGRATYDGVARLGGGRRPWVLTRSAFTGVQRYAASWMGDNSSWWEHLEQSLPQLTSMGLSGEPHVGVDIGGFFDNPSPELYARWIEMGTFYPFMRTHTCAGTIRQEPWSFGAEVEDIARRSIKLRYRLLPYLYTLAHEAHRTGAPLLRPLFFDFPNDPATFHRHDQVMVGPDMMVTPIYHPGNDYRMVYLPAGVWYDFWSGKHYDGPAQLTVHAPLGRIPLWVRGGAVLPLGNVRRSTTEPLSELTLMVFPAGASEGGWIEDDGETLAFEQGEIAETRVTVRAEPSQVTVRVAARQGTFQPHPRHLTLQLHTVEYPTTLTFDGVEQEAWTWEDELRAAVLSWFDDGEAHEIVARW